MTQSHFAAIIPDRPLWGTAPDALKKVGNIVYISGCPDIDPTIPQVVQEVSAEILYRAKKGEQIKFQFQVSLKPQKRFSDPKAGSAAIGAVSSHDGFAGLSVTEIGQNICRTGSFLLLPIGARVVFNFRGKTREAYRIKGTITKHRIGIIAESETDQNPILEPQMFMGRHEGEGPNKDGWFGAVYACENLEIYVRGTKQQRGCRFENWAPGG